MSVGKLTVDTSDLSSAVDLNVQKKTQDDARERVAQQVAEVAQQPTVQPTALAPSDSQRGQRLDARA